MFIFDHKKFRKDRIAQNFTYGSFAKALQKYVPKASKPIIYNWENGSVPTVNYLFAIAKVLGREPHDYMRIATEDEIKIIEKRKKKALKNKS